MINKSIVFASIFAISVVGCATNEERKAKPVSAQTTVILKGSETDVGAAAATDDGGTIVCKQRTRTGTRLGGSKVCLTKAEWERRANNDEEALRTIQNNQVRSVN